MKKIRLFMIALALAASSHTFAQERPLHEVYSMMMYNFTRYVEWPVSTGHEFIIGVVGNKDVYNTLNAWYAGKPKGTKTYVIRLFRTAEEVTDCAVLFIDKSRSSEFAIIKEKVKGKGTLIITDHDGLGAKGSTINFITVDNKLKFELNHRAFETANLKVSGALTSMAILI
jgi:hypothetical protein